MIITVCNYMGCVKIESAFLSWFPCAAWEPILDALHPVGISTTVLSRRTGMRRIPHCVPMRRMGTRKNEEERGREKYGKTLPPPTPPETGKKLHYKAPSFF